MAGVVPTEQERPLFTRCEAEVAALVFMGKSSKEVAEILGVSKRTVDLHLANIYDKLEVHNRLAAYLACQKRGLLP